MNTPEASSKVLVEVARQLGDHYLWLPKLLWRAGCWRWLIPWPLLLLPNRFTGSKEHGSLWLTLVLISAYFVGADSLQNVDGGYAADAARTLFAGSFLVITMLSLSVALPGQAILKLVLEGEPLFAVEFVSPTLWAFLWGISGGTCMTFHKNLPLALQPISTTVALYAFAMEVNAVLYTIRTYTLGLVLSAHATSKAG